MGSGRRFNSRERVALYLDSGGLCVECGIELEQGWHGDHIKPWAYGGETDVANGQALCPACNQIKGARRTMQLRDWQVRALETFDRSESQNFLMVATPGAGKSRCAVAIAKRLIERRAVARVVVVAPSDHLRHQWAEEFDQADLEANPNWINSDTVWPAGFDCVSVTYAQVASSPLLFRKVTSAARTLVILDEVHHCGTKKAYGDSILLGFEPAAVRLLLSGTPFRSDGSRIPFVRYVDGEAVPDDTYGYDKAVRDGVCRPIFFPAFGGRMEWVGPGGDVTAATFDDDLGPDDQSRRLRTALSTSGNWLRDVLAQAHTQLEEYRAEDPDAGGLVVTMDQQHAPAVADLLRSVTGVDPVVVVSEDPDASMKIKAFRKSRSPWIVAVKMISEGVDIPRLRACVYATNVVSELTFRQVVGRVVRIEPDGADHTGAVFIPDDPRLIAFAEAIKEQRNYALEEETDELLKGRETEDRQGARDNLFLPLTSEAHGAGAVFDGDRYPKDEIARARALKAQVAGLCADDVQLAQFLRLAGAVPAEASDRVARVPKRDRVARLRTQNKRYVQMIVRRHLPREDASSAYRRANAVLNGAVMVKVIAQASEEDLAKRLEYAKAWLETGKEPRGA